LQNGVALFFRRCGAFSGFGAAKCEDSLVFLEFFEGTFFFNFDVGTGFGSLFFNGFVGLNGDGFVGSNGNGFGAFGVLGLGFGEAARFFFFWRTRVDDSRLTGRSLLRRPLRSLDPSVSCEAVTWGQ
jgi:hypothetical protein